MKKTDFLDLELNLENSKHCEYRKPGDTLQYINVRSNHLPNIIKQIPTMVAKRLSRLCTNENIVNKHKAKYEKALEESGYSSPYFENLFGQVEGYDRKHLYTYLKTNKNRKKSVKCGKSHGSTPHTISTYKLT